MSEPSIHATQGAARARVQAGASRHGGARHLALALLAAGAAWLAAPQAAQARDVYWSVGVGGPGLSVGVGNVPVYNAPVYHAPVHVRPAPVYVRPAPVYVQPAPVYRGGYRPRHPHGYRGDYGRQPVYVMPPVQHVQPAPGYVRHGGHSRHPGQRYGYGRR